MKGFGYDVREDDPFEEQMHLPIAYQVSPYATRLRLMWEDMREIPAAQTDESQSSADLMWAKANNSGTGYTKDGTTAPVALTFGHCLSKLTMNCTVDASVGLYLQEVITDGKRYDRYVEDLVNSHRYIDCDNAVCRS